MRLVRMRASICLNPVIYKFYIFKGKMDKLCRICLTTSKNLSNLLSKDTKYNKTILNLLEIVTGQKLILNPLKLPSNICQMCLSFLKISYDFRLQFEQSQRNLEVKTGEAPFSTKAMNSAVELIYGGEKFDLKQVLVVEELDNKVETFDGFLKNLGSEVSARFVGGALKEDLPPKGDSITISRVPRKGLVSRIPKMLVCEICGFASYKRQTFSYHMRNHRGKTRFECNICDKKFASKSYLTEHLRGHTNQRDFLCNVCGKNFIYSVSLRYHMKLHSEKSLQCRYCDLKFRMPNSLKIHIRTHSRERPFKCDYCSKCFKQRGTKINHELLHTGAKRYSCQYCGKGYIKNYNLKKHYLTHSGPNYCHYCSRTFIDVKFLNEHMKLKHGDVSLSIEQIVSFTNE